MRLFRGLRHDGAVRVVRLLPLVALVAFALLAAMTRRTPGDRPGYLRPELAFHPPDLAHPLGFGEGGVDLARLLSHAELRGLALAASVAVAGLLIGTPLGAAAALSRGTFERAVLRACDLLQAFPTFLFALTVLSAVRAPGRGHLFFVFALTAWAPFARLALVETRALRSQSFVEAARALGASRARVLLHHLIPSLMDLAAVQLGSTGAAVVVSEASLGFVGFGPPDGVSLGAVLDQGVAAMLRAPHVLLVGASAVFLTSSALLLAGRALGRGAR